MKEKNNKEYNLDGGRTDVPQLILSINMKDFLKEKKAHSLFNGIFYSSISNFRSIYPKEIT